MSDELDLTNYHWKSCMSNWAMTCMMAIKKNMKVVIERLKEEGIRKDIIVMVGGAPLNETFAEAIEADTYC